AGGGAGGLSRAGAGERDHRLDPRSAPWQPSRRPHAEDSRRAVAGRTRRPVSAAARRETQARLPPQRARLSSPDCGDGRARAGGDAGVARALEQRGGAHPLPTPRAWVPPSGGDRERELTREYHYKLLVLLALSQAIHLPSAQTHETKPWTRSA